jgi:hypothetical protein
MNLSDYSVLSMLEQVWQKSQAPFKKKVREGNIMDYVLGYDPDEKTKLILGWASEEKEDDNLWVDISLRHVTVQDFFCPSCEPGVMQSKLMQFVEDFEANLNNNDYDLKKRYSELEEFLSGT